MSFHCPRFGVLLYGTHCTECDCDLAPGGRPVARTLNSNPLPPGRREFVILPRDPNQKPDVPLRVPTHYCLDCGQREVPCFECGGILHPLTATREGYHIARCDAHGGLAVVCPHRGLADRTAPSIAGDSDAAPQISWRDLQYKQLHNALVRADAAMASQDLRTDPRVWRVATVALLVGVVLGLVLGTMLAAPLIVHFSRQQQAPTLVE